MNFYYTKYSCQDHNSEEEKLYTNKHLISGEVYGKFQEQAKLNSRGTISGLGVVIDCE